MGSEWHDLVMTKPDTLRIIDFIADHPDCRRHDFAHLLLRDFEVVEVIWKENKDKGDFIRAVLSKWLESESDCARPCTWTSLIECMENARMDASKIKAVKDQINVS